VRCCDDLVKGGGPRGLEEAAGGARAPRRRSWSIMNPTGRGDLGRGSRGISCALERWTRRWRRRRGWVTGERRRRGPTAAKRDQRGQGDTERDGVREGAREKW
jgi:hypothetical protein